MKKITAILILFMILMLSSIQPLTGQHPPHQGDIPQGSGHGPVGGSGPVGEGLILLLASGIFYSVKKFRSQKKL